MKIPSAALLLTISTLTAPFVSAQGVSVISLTALHESSQLAPFQEENGDCRFYGEIDNATGDVHIEVKTCPEVGGSLIEEPFSATVEIDEYPVPAGTHFYLKQ